MTPSQMFLVVCLVALAAADDEPAINHRVLELDKPYSQQLTEAEKFTGRYVFNIPTDNVDKLNSDRWFFFVEVEPEESNEWVQTTIELSVGQKGKEESDKIRNCGTRNGGVDSCYITNKQFDYKTQEVHVKVECKEPCKFKISGEVSAPYKITPNEPLKLDFEDTAYSKMFTLDTSRLTDIDQLRIILKPDGFLQFAAPIHLYVNQGSELPSTAKHDMKGITLWDNGKGVFLDSPDCSGIFTILVEGPQKNILQLTAQTVKFKESNELIENQPYFDYIGDGTTKYYKAPINKEKGVKLQTTTFSGAIKFDGIYDEELKHVSQEFDGLYRSYSELEYEIPPSFFRENESSYKLKDFVVFAIRGEKDSTFLIETFPPQTGISHLLPERNQYVDLEPKKSKQYYIQLTEFNIPQFKGADIEIITTSHEGQKLDPKFYECKHEKGSECQLTDQQLSGSSELGNQLTKMEVDNKSFVMGVGVYKMSIDRSKFQKIKGDVLVYHIVVVIENKADVKELFTIQYINQETSEYLKQGEMVKGRVSIDEKKYYQFTNFDSDVEEIIIHHMKISGKVSVVGYRQDPRKADLKDSQVTQFRGAIRFDNPKVKQTVYIEVEGKEAAYYTLQLQLIKKKEKQEYDKNDTSTDKKGYNEIILVEDIHYDFVIEPKSKAVYQLHTKQKKFYLEMSSLLPVDICMTEVLNKPPFAPNCEETEQLSDRRIMLDVTMDVGNIANIGVVNNEEKSNKFSIFFRALKQISPKNETTDEPIVLKCSAGKMGKLTKNSFKANTSSCFSYVTNDLSGLEVVMDVANDEYSKVHTTVDIGGGVERRLLLGSYKVFTEEEIKNDCKNQVPCTITVNIETQVETDITLTAQSLNAPMQLLDGIGNEFHGAQTRHFIYEIVNKVNTSIILHNVDGYYKFYGKVVDASEYWAGREEFPNEEKNVITSHNPFYYAYQTQILTEAEIKGTICKQCLLLLTVKRSEDGGREKNRFIIEVTQEDSFLKDSRSVAGYVDSGSYAYYEFYNSKNGTMMVSLNTQHKDCATLMIRKGNNKRVSGSEHDQKDVKGKLIVTEAKEGMYSIGVEGTDHCFYNIEAVSSENKVFSTLQRGMDRDMEINKDQTKRFVFRNEYPTTFRILSLHQQGEATFKIKKYADLKELLGQTRNQLKYDYSSVDMAIIQSNQTYFCDNCTYLIDVTSSRSTKTTLMVPTKESYFPIQVDSYFKDELSEGEVEHLRVFSSGENCMFELRVHYGEVEVRVYTANNDEMQFSQKYSSSEEVAVKDISDIFKSGQTDDHGGKTPFIFMRYLKIQIEAQKHASYTFGMISSKDKSKRGERVELGIPQYVSLTKDQEHCMRGTFDNKGEEFLISVTGDKQLELMNMMTLWCKVGGKDQELSKNIAKNEMLVTIDNPSKLPETLPADYEFCMTSNQNVYLTFIQSATVNTLPQGKAFLVHKQTSVTFYSEGRNLVEINECGSRAVVSISNKFNTGKTVSSQIQQVRKSNNIIEFNHYGPVFIHVEATSATVLWRQKDTLSGRGTGYDEYSSNKIRIDKSTETMLNVEVYPVKQIAENTKVKLKMVNYTVFVAREETPLYEAMNCDDGRFIQNGVFGSYLDRPSVITIAVEDIVKQFKNDRYVLVGALAIATPEDTNDVPYRFIYPYQQIPLQMLLREGNLIIDPVPIDPQPFYPEPIDRSEPWTTFQVVVVALAVLLVVLFLSRWVYRRFIKKWLRRRSRLSDQGSGQVRYTEFTSYN